MDIYTSRFSYKIPEEYQAIGIAVGKPKWPLGYALENYNVLAPFGIFNKNYSQAEYRLAYFKRLDSYGPERIKRDLEGFSRRSGGKDVVLLCYENLCKHGEWCHRTQFAEWWKEKTGESIIELEEKLDGKKFNVNQPEPEKKQETEEDTIPKAVKARMEAMKDEDQISLF